MPPQPTSKLSEVIATLDTGNIDAAGTLDLQALVEEVQQRGKAGKLTIELTIEPQGLQSQAVQVLANVKVSHPKPPPAGSVLFVGDHGSLHRSDPYQQSFTTSDTDA